MSDYTLPPSCTLIVGKTGSGKTTFAFRALGNSPDATCRFVFDDLGQCAHRLNKPHAIDSHGLEMSLASGWSVFYPHHMFTKLSRHAVPVEYRNISPLDRAFRYWCEWVYDCCRRVPGKKLVFIDEVWRFQTPHGIPDELAMLTQAGRAEGVQLIVATQLPHKVHSSITGMSTELVCFRLDERLALDSVEAMGMDRTRIGGQPLGQFIALNRLSGAELCGKLF